MARDTALFPAELQTFLSKRTGWKVVAGQLERTLEFPAFLDGIAFVQQLAVVAEAEDHHPDLDIRGAKVTVRLFTHDAKAITFRDVKLAEETDRLSSALQAK